MKFISLFTGIRGIDVALERAGMTCVWQVERNKACQSVIRRHAPGVPLIDDVVRFRAMIEHERFAARRPVRPDLICGGFPCQDVSVAGRRAGLAGSRSGLWFVFRRIIAKQRPRWLLIENVPGLLSSNGGRDMGTILRSLGQLGYGWAYRVLDAQWFGVPQRRRRVFIVGCLGDGRRAAEVLFESDCLPWNPPPRRESRTRVAGTIAAGAHPGGFNGRDIEHHGRSAGNDSYPHNLVTHTLRSEGHDASEDGMGRGAPLVVGQNGSDVQCSEQMGTLKSSIHKQTTGPVLYFDRAQVTSPQNRANPQVGGPCHTLHVEAPMLASPSAVRRLTPRERERLQGFPDDYTRWDEHGNEISDSARYRMIGNAVAIPVVEWIGRRIMAVS